jgi:hypothetical protein
VNQWDHLGLEVSEKDSLGFSAYIGLGGGASVTSTTKKTKCCDKNGEEIEGIIDVTITASAEAGVGLGGNISIAGWHNSLLLKGPQIVNGKFVELSISNSTCGEYDDMSAKGCSSIGTNWGLSGSIGLGPFAASVGGQVSAEIKGCLEISGRNYTFTVEGCWDNGAYASATLGTRTWTANNSKNDTGCKIIKSVSGNF